MDNEHQQHEDKTSLPDDHHTNALNLEPGQDDGEDIDNGLSQNSEKNV